VLAALLVVGSLSDHVGRRPVLLAALAGQAAAMVVFATAAGVPELMAARVIQGLATGAAAGAVGASLLDLHRTRGTLANAVAPITGTATGALGAGLLVQYLPDPSRLVYLILLVIFAVQAVGVLLMAESSPKRTGALASLRPAFSLPAAVRGPLLRSVPALIALCSLGGLYASLGPALVAQITGQHSFVLGGLSVAVLAGTGAAAVLLLRSAPPAAVMLTACIALFAGVGITLVAVQLSSAVVFFAGTVVAGPASAPGSRAWSAACCRTHPPISGPACCRSSGWCPTWPWACPRSSPGCSWCTAAASEARPASTARRSCCWPRSPWPAWSGPSAASPRPFQYQPRPRGSTTTRSWSTAADPP
jgi:MFS family permease